MLIKYNLDFATNKTLLGQKRNQNIENETYHQNGRE